MTPQLILSTLQHEIHLNAQSKGFWEVSENVGEKVALCHSELSEFFEAYRRQKTDKAEPDEHCPQFSNQEIELADTVIRIFDLAGYLRFDLAGAILAKMEYNKGRPRLHGKKF